MWKHGVDAEVDRHRSLLAQEKLGAGVGERFGRGAEVGRRGVWRRGWNNLKLRIATEIICISVELSRIYAHRKISTAKKYTLRVQFEELDFFNALVPIDSNCNIINRQ